MTIRATTRPFALAATGLVLAGTLAACGGGGSADTGSGVTGTGPSAPAARSAASAGAASRAADVAFAQSMIPHHQQAVEMGDLALRNATSAQVKQLAGQIKAAQDPEIEVMRGWLKSWGVDEGMAGMEGHDMPGMPGMMSEADMRTLAATRGADFDRMWLQMMIAHHQGALTIADQVLAATPDPQVRALAEAVVSGQTKEIDTMKSLLAG